MPTFFHGSYPDRITCNGRSPCKKHTAGFTLIELLVVISIIAMLASIVLTSVNDARTKARDVRRIQDLKQIQIALELYFNDHGNYPVISPDFNGAGFRVDTSNDGWGNNSDGSGPLANSLPLTLVAEGYISELPLDPKNTSSAISPFTAYGYTYVSNGGGSSYDLITTFETDHPLRCENNPMTYRAGFNGITFPPGSNCTGGTFTGPPYTYSYVKNFK